MYFFHFKSVFQGDEGDIILFITLYFCGRVPDKLQNTSHEFDVEYYTRRLTS